MNKFIAGLFGDLVACIHIITILGVVALVIAYKSGGYEYLSMIPPGKFYPLLLLSFLAYIVIFGAVTTFIVINERLSDAINELRDLRKSIYDISMPTLAYKAEPTMGNKT